MIEFVLIGSAAIPEEDMYLIPKDLLAGQPMMQGESMERFVRRLLSDPATARQVCVIRGIGKP